MKTRNAILDELLPDHGEGLEVVGNIAFDFGIHTSIGKQVFINFNFTVLDSNQVSIGDNVMFGPNVSLLPPVHPLRWQDRNIRRGPNGTYYNYEYSRPITIGRNCWLAGNVTVIGGVTIGEGSVVGAGSVVTHDVPANSVVVGNPAHVIRTIDDRVASANQEYGR